MPSHFLLIILITFTMIDAQTKYSDINEEISKGNSFGTIEAVKTVGDLFAPFSGNVTEINKKLAESPETVNTDPYGEGWMIKAEINNMGDLDDLLDARAYKALIGQ